MKCPSCGQEVLLAETCPYCGAKVSQAQPERSSTGKGANEKGTYGEQAGQSKAARGAFRGRIESDGDWWRSGTPGQQGRKPHPFSLKDSLKALGRYLIDWKVPFSRKIWVLAAILYILSPVDLIPGFGVPVIGWIDDLVVLGILWAFVNSELDRYRL